MTEHCTHAPGRAQQADSRSVIEKLSHFEGPPQQFIQALLGLQCSLSGARQAALLRKGDQDRVEPVAVHPPPAPDAARPAWLAVAVAAAGKTLATGQTTIVPIHQPDGLYGDPPRSSCVLLPLRRAGHSSGLAAFQIDSTDKQILTRRADQLELSAALLQLYEMRLTLRQRQQHFARLRRSVEILSAVNNHSRFLPAAMAMCNELVQRFDAQSACLGLVRGRYVQVKAMSETEEFDRKTEQVQQVEAAMEEAVDQDIEIAYPPDEESLSIARAAGDLARHGSVSTVLTLPLRRDGKVAGALTLQRDADNPFDPEEIALLRLTCELTSARILELSRTDRWFGARAAEAVRKSAAAAVGPRHTWIKLLAIGICGFLAFALLAQGRRTADGNCTIVARQWTELTAPFGDRLIEVHVGPGDTVTKGQLLASLRSDKIEALLAQAEADEAIAMREYSAHLDAGKRSDARIALLKARQAQARVRQYKTQLADSKIIAPVDGTVIEGDWKRQSAPPVEQGQKLFVIAPARELEAELLIPEDQIVGVQPGATGKLAATGKPEFDIDFVVDWVSPVAEVVGQENVYRVRASLQQQPEWLRHGIEGIAKVHLGRASYARLWTAPVVDWVRMKLWW